MINHKRGLQALITSYHICVDMEMIEMFGWIVLGFLPCFVGLELVSRKMGYPGKVILRTSVVGGEI
jgi:hypothetical protein